MDARVSVESGRLVFVPVQCPVTVPMADFCLQLPVEPGKLWLTVSLGDHPDKVKRKRVTNLELCQVRLGRPCAVVLVVSPLLFVGDAAFYYPDKRKSAEYDRAVYSSRSESTMVGSYRTDDGQVAACVRLGDKECELAASQGSEAGLHLYLTPTGVQLP